MIGRTVGNYVIQTKVGEGGMGAVYVAVHPHINRRVAIKVLHPGADRAPEMVRRFFNEARATTEMHNEHIVEVLDFGELPEKTPYLVMEWLQGQNLGRLLQAEQKLPPARVAHIVRGIVRALKAAHGKGVIHRDLKPDNVFLCRRESDPDFVKVLDFGIAKLIATDPSGAAHHQTQTGAIMGTPQYMSPEQCRGAKEIDHRTDIYSLGVMAYQMLSGRLPFTADSLGELLFKHLSESPPPLDPSVPAAVAAVVARSLDKVPDKRPTLAEIAAVMEAAETGAAGSGPVRVEPPVVAPPSSTAAPAPVGPPTTLGSSAREVVTDEQAPSPPAARRSGRIVAGAGMVVALVVAVVVLRKPSPPNDLVGPAAVVAPAAPAPVAASIQIEIRTVPESAELKIDGERVANPYTTEATRDARARVVTASLAGFSAARQEIAFDRHRTLVLTLAPVAAAPASGKVRQGPHPAVDRKEAAATPAAKAGVPARLEKGYRGSKLDIETDFPAGSR